MSLYASVYQFQTFLCAGREKRFTMLKSNPTSMKRELFYSLFSVQDQFLEVFFLQPENIVISLTTEVGTGLEQKQRPLCAC